MSETSDRVRAFIARAGIAAAVPVVLQAREERLALAESPIRDMSALTFPTDLISEGSRNAYMGIAFKAYRRSSIRNPPTLQFQSGIRLPLPTNLTDSFKVTYDTSNLGAAMGSAAAGFQGAVNSNNLLQLGQVAATSALGTVAGAGLEVVQRNARELYAGLSSLSGQAANPFMTVLFKAPDFKTHSFSWKLVPKDERETEIVNNIIKMFRYHMLPSLDSTTVVYGYPEILEIQLFPRNEYLYKFKPCVIIDFSANFAPNGPSLYTNGAPAAVEIKISLQEIELWSKSDFRSSDFRSNAGPLYT